MTTDTHPEVTFVVSTPFDPKPDTGVVCYESRQDGWVCTDPRCPTHGRINVAAQFNRETRPNGY